jgi:hypothetical protein
VDGELVAFDADGRPDLPLNYAATREELLAMCRTIADCLKPGCRFVSVNNNPAQPREEFPLGRPYGFVKSADEEPRENRHLVVVMDQAPPHVSKKTRRYIESQKRLHVFYLPKYSPDWNPDEKVWNHLKNQELKAHRARTKAELRDLTEHRLEKMSRDRRLLQGLFFRCCVADLFE